MQTIRKRKLYQEVLDQLISAVLTSRYAPGSKLPSEKDLMESMGVGRPAIREAMQALQQMGLVRISHGERARVINPTPDVIVDQMSSAMIMMLATNARGLDDLKEARLMLEVALVRLATQRATAAGIERLTEAQRALRSARGDPARFVSADMAFHAAVADMCGNALVAAVVRGMLGWLTRFKRDLVSVKGAERLTIEEHDRILRAVAGGDAAAAAAAMADHLSRANALYQQLGQGRIADGDEIVRQDQARLGDPELM